MSKLVRFKTRQVVDNDNKPVETLEDGLSLIAKCDGCGCDQCNQYYTIEDQTTGDLYAIYIDGGTLRSRILDQAAKDFFAMKRRERNA